MNAQLAGAFNSLRNAGAKDLPSAAEVEKGQDGQYWSGTKKDGTPWVLVKNKEDSYNVTC